MPSNAAASLLGQGLQLGGAARHAARREGGGRSGTADEPLPYHLDVHVRFEALRLLLCSGLDFSVVQVSL